MLVRVPCGEVFDSLTSSKDDMEEREVEEGDCLGVSFGEPEADDLALLRVAIRGGIAVEAMVYMNAVNYRKNKSKVQVKYLPCGRLPGTSHKFKEQRVVEVFLLRLDGGKWWRTGG